MHESLTLKTGNLLTVEENFIPFFWSQDLKAIIMVDLNNSYYFYFLQIVSIHQMKYGEIEKNNFQCNL